MFTLALKNLLSEKGRLVLGVAGVAFANTLIMFHVAMLLGTFSQITKHIEKTDADIWVLQEGLSDVTSSTSFVSGSNIEAIRKIDGVERVTGLFLYYTSVKIRQKVENVFLVGYDSESGVGGPWRLAKGKSNVEGDEIIMDESLAKSEALDVGDEINISGHKLKIAGLSKETSAVATQYIFISKESVLDYLNLNNIYNYLLVSCRKRADIGGVLEEINRIKGVDAYTRQKLAENTLRFWGKFLVPLLTTLVIVSFLVGTTVIGIVVHNITLHKQKEYGILLALGASSASVCAIVLWQGAFVGSSGFIGGALISAVAIHIANDTIPGMTACLDHKVLAISILLTWLMIMFSTIAPLARILKTDPFEIFRG
ncbi:ABC transporter permease [Candidatus Poribacteria bacterium]|nr:ABC transporter permease [Candidatus Poribacteria bacterium]